ncbi:GlxA family transcriptional regulator [Komagataeibacter medellinensis]|uniref:Transcriptional regulator AraC family n=1 Tax=Komagataeibacter medellinensis (strain NBRC 3288 / BCRC 11682 / LMG 1693 / Kondo 51) TaxID=634177 RepID=G2I427_KOMMN|nr:GlxA family transcriptional regulator [Komagataeibacter medellinensis]BAK82874.1 transcriptional regulator AraC family [Komagataeibacter medellinensis NBRC 3288]
MIRAIGFVLYPDFQLLDAAGPTAAFEIAGRIAGQPYTLAMLSRAGGLVMSSSGVAVQTVAVEGAGGFDTLIIVGGEGHRAAMECGVLRAFMQARMAHTRRICSVCSGAFVLAGAGLLAGRRATTHWRHAQEFRRQFSDIRLEPDALYIHDGPVWTAAGISAGIDLALALVGHDLGDDIARQAARQMVVYHRRPGGQSQFSALLEMEGGERFSTLLGWVRAHLAQPLGVDVLAARAGMSARNFSRAFRAAVGVSPARAVERLRLEAAYERVVYSTDPVEAIARTTGFHDPERMRRAFIRAFGLPPQAVRRNAAR